MVWKSCAKGEVYAGEPSNDVIEGKGMSKKSHAQSRGRDQRIKVECARHGEKRTTDFQKPCKEQP